jgi:hypothetical protein
MQHAPEISRPEEKAVATLAARCALAGYALTRQPGGGFFVSRWGYGTELENEAAVEAWLQRALGPAS